MTNFLVPVIKGFTDVLYPLRKGLSSSEDFELMLVKYGWDAQINGGQMDAIHTAFAIEPLVLSVLEKLDTFINGINQDRATAALELVSAFKDTAHKLHNLSAFSSGLPFPLDQSQFWTGIREDLFADLLAGYFEKRQPVLYGILHFSGVISYEKAAPAGTNRIPYIKTVLDFGKLGGLFTAPFDQFKENYKWNTPGHDFDHLKLLRTLERILLAFRLPAMVNLPRETAASRLLDINQIGPQDIRELYLPLVDGISPGENAYWKIGLLMLPIPEPLKSSGRIKGLALIPLLQGQLEENIYFSKETYLRLTGAFDIDADVLLKTYPGKTELDASLPDTELNASMELIGDPERPWLLLGASDASRLELGGFKVMFGVKGTPANPEVLFSIGTGSMETNQNPRLSFVFKPDGADSFITKMLGEEGFRIDFQSNLIWSSKNGLAFEGQAGFEVELPIHVSFGPIEITTLNLALRGGNTGSAPNARADFGIGVKGDIGPLSFVVENIGTSLQLEPIGPSASKGLLGSHDLSFGFKPPNGIGLSINAGAVMGGGYLFFDVEKEEYAGALELTIAGFISAKAIGLITTKMPDGSEGFSMLIMITAEFFPPFQLGYGFTLNAVGGLLGLNRTVLLDPLREGVRTGSVNNIMFPTDVLTNASRIISDLKSIFPAYEGKFLIGPMAKIGWGTPTLISLSFGLIIEIPGNIAILGVLKLILPDEKVPIVKIQVAFVGTIDFGKKMLTFDASLYESSILQTLTLEGDMAVRVAWGDQPNFLLTVGGFHPSFTPPPLALPTLRRLAVNILNTSIARIRVECYQAVTSNTVQFGARAEIFFDLKACSIDGHIGFDALFQFNPFYFIIELSAGFKLRAVGISLMTVRVKMSLEGPTPWHAKGTGKVSLLFFDISANFDKTWGQRKTTTLPQIAILPLFLEQLQKKEQWNAVLSTGKNLSVSLRKLDEATENLLVLHPAGSLVLQQKLLPLNVNIDKIGNQKTSDVKQLNIASASSNGTALTIKEVKESFARAQYQNLSDAEKLSKPSFEKMQGGVEIAMTDNTIQNGRMVRKKIGYELTILDKEPVKPFPFGKFFLEPWGMFHHFIKGNSISKSKLSKHALEKLQPFEQKLDIQEELFAVAYQINNKAFNTVSTFSSEMEAQRFMQEQIRTNPNLKQQIHIVPQFELQDS